MSNQLNSQPSLCIDLKKNRIRIHRNTIHLLGDPDYILLLVNPAEAKIAICKSSSQDHLAHKIYQSSDDCFELYSSGLMENLVTVNNGLEYNSSYRLYGNIDTRTGMACFSMLDPVLLKE